MKLFRQTLAAVALLLPLATAAAAQSGTVTGVVTDAMNGQPLSGAQMVLAGTNLGGLTNENGRYVLTNVPVGMQRVRAVIIGYGQQTQEVNVTAGATAVADFRLETSAINLEAIVVSAATGREQRLREVGTSVGTIDVEELNPAPITSVADMLGGRTEGVILQDVNGTTGSAQRIRIRGANSLSLSNEPLIFIDGVQISNETSGFGVGGQQRSALNDINPGDISNVEIIKGPAASAMYGTAAANGVILITTKRGRPGNTQWQFFTEVGQLDDKTDYPAVYGAYQTNNSNLPLFTESGFFNSAGYAYCPNRLAATGSCTQDGALSFNTLTDPRTRFFSTGNRGRYGASVRGGNEAVRFFVSGQYEDETGVIDFNTSEQVNLRANLDAALADNADLSVSVGYSDGLTQFNSNDNSIFSPLINGLIGQPYYVPRDPNSSIEGENINNYGFGFNLVDLRKLTSDQEVDRFTTSTNMRFRPTNWLTLNGNAGLDLAGYHDFETLQPGELPIAVSYDNGYRQSQRTTRALYTGILSAVGQFEPTDDLVATTTVGSQYTQSNRRNTYCYGSSLVPGTASCGTVSALFSIDEDFFEERTIGVYLNQELAWRDRVFLAAGIRGDDNSNFGSELGLFYFPSASLSWVVSEEDFFPEMDWLSAARLRTAWGASGLTPGFRDAVTLYSPTTVATEAGDVPGVALSSTGNALLEPERTTEFEIGADLGLFNDRLAVDFAYFRKQSKDALIERNLPGSLGLTTSVFANLGKIRNSGTELGLRLNVLNSEGFGLDLGFNNTSLDNEIVELGEGIEDIVFNRGLQRHSEGFPAGGFFQQRVTYNDADGNGKLSLDEVTVADEAEYIGPALPTWQRSVFADVRIADFLTISTLFEGRGGNYTGNDSEAFTCGRRSTYGCAAVGDPNATLDEQAAYLADRYLGSAGGYVEKADFWRWRELSLAFDVPASLSDRVGALDGLRLTLAGRNLAIWTDYTGLDPETNEGGGASNFSQSEFNTQPPVRYLMLRLDYIF